MSKDPWSHLGITGETQIRRTLFDPYSESVIVHFYRKLESHYGVSSLYGRHIAEETYHRISEQTDGLSFECPVLSPAGSHVFVNVMETSQHDGKYTGYNWNSVRKIDITSNEVISAIDNTDLRLDEAYFRGWISDILGVGADGETAYCNLGLQRKKDGGGGKVDYHVAKVSLKEKKYETITKLGDVFL